MAVSGWGLLIPTFMLPAAPEKLAALFNIQLVALDSRYWAGFGLRRTDERMLAFPVLLVSTVSLG